MKCGDVILSETATQTGKYCVIPLQLHMVPRVVKLIDSESEWWLGGDGGWEGNGELFCTGYRVSVL